MEDGAPYDGSKLWFKAVIVKPDDSRAVLEGRLCNVRLDYEIVVEEIGRVLAVGVDPADARGRTSTLEWLFWQMAGLGPMTGQYGHFHVYAPEPIEYAQTRYANEANRLLGVLDRRLAGRAFVAGDEYTIADMAIYPWIGVYDKAPIDMAPYPEVRRWHAAIRARPATARAYALAKQVNPDAGKPMSDEQKKLLFGIEPKR